MRKKVFVPEVMKKPPRDTFYDGIAPSTFFQRLQQRSRVLRATVVLVENITGARVSWEKPEAQTPRKVNNPQKKVLEPDEITKDGMLVFLASEKLYRRYPLPIARAIDRLGDFLLRNKRRIENLFTDRHTKAMDATDKATKRYAEEYGSEEPIIARREKSDKETSL